MRSFKAKYEIQLHREVEWPYMRGKYVLTAHTPISLGTIGKIVGIFLYISFIQCFFFIELKVFVNLTYLYLSEIKKQGLIFSVEMGH